MRNPEHPNTLRVLSGPLAGATFEVGPRLLIGRVPACDVVLADVEVSREHAMIVTDGETPMLVDLASSNGTLVNGKKVERLKLVPGTTFTISNSKFMFDKAPPISTRPVLASQFVKTVDLDRDTPDSRPTQETPAAGGVTVTSDERPTRRALQAVESADPKTSGRATIRLEAATADPNDGDRPTVELRAVGAEAAAKPEVTPGAEPLVFAPPPTPMPEKPEPSEAPPKFTPIALGKDVYPGDLLADITDYRSFRLRLQRGDIPTGEEVAAMIDMEAMLREPPPESSPRRDVVTQRFFRRFNYAAELSARFTSGRDVVEVKGTIKNLSVDGVQCVLDFGNYNPEPNQLAMLVVDHTRGFLDVRYSITARIVYRRKDMAGFVFAGVPSWAERGEFQHVETAVRGRSED